jgi:phosphatidylglycerophosphate synthase
MRKEMIKNNNNKFDYWKSLKISPTDKMNKIKFVDIYLNRPVAALIVRMVYNTRITPNGLTYFSLFLGLLGAFFFSRGDYLYFILGGVFTQLSSIVDGADGMLARAKNICSDYGSHLDLLFDRIIDFSLFIGIAMGAGVYFNNPNLRLLGFLEAGLFMLRVNVFYLIKSYRQVKEKGETGEVRAILMWSVLIFAVVNRLDIFIYLMLIETVIAFTVLLIRFFRLGKKRDSLLPNGFEQSQQSESSQQQRNDPPDQHQG